MPVKSPTKRAHRSVRFPSAHEAHGAGYYRSTVSPGSPFDLEARARVGVYLYVLQLQFCGAYLCYTFLVCRAPTLGMVISSQTPFNGYQAGVYKRNEPMKLMTYPLEQAEVWKKREDGTMLLRGEQWDEGELHRWPQTWICGRNPSPLHFAGCRPGWIGSMRRLSGRLMRPTAPGNDR